MSQGPNCLCHSALALLFPTLLHHTLAAQRSPSHKRPSFVDVFNLTLFIASAHTHTRAMLHMWRSENNFLYLGLSF